MLTQLFDHIGGIEPPLVHPGTTPRPSFPASWGGDIKTPEGPGPALPGAGFIHRASEFSVKEDAIQVLLLNKADDTASHDARVLSAKLGLGEIETEGERGDLLISDPHGAGKSGAAISASQAVESQTVFIPKFFSHATMLFSSSDIYCCTKKIKTLNIVQ
jgi:hypothetical protein